MEQRCVATVLIVEDEKEIRRFVRLALEGEALKVFDADTLQRSLKMKKRSGALCALRWKAKR